MESRGHQTLQRNRIRNRPLFISLSNQHPFKHQQQAGNEESQGEKQKEAKCKLNGLYYGTKTLNKNRLDQKLNTSFLNSHTSTLNEHIKQSLKYAANEALRMGEPEKPNEPTQFYGTKI